METIKWNVQTVEKEVTIPINEWDLSPKGHINFFEGYGQKLLE